MAQTETKNVINTIPIKNLLSKSSVNNTDILVIEDDTTTYHIKAADLTAFIRETVKDTFLQLTEKGTADGVAPLNDNTKLPPDYLSFGKTAETVYDGADGKCLEDMLAAHKSDYSNPHHTTPVQLGLGSVENKSSKTIRSEITAENVITALGYKPESDGAYENAITYMDSKIAELIDGAPETLDTLKEIAEELSSSKEIIDTLNTLLAKKAEQKELDSHTGNGTIHVTVSDKEHLHTSFSHAQSIHARTDATKVERSASNGSILINGTETGIYEHPLSTAAPGTYRQVTVDEHGHIIGGSNTILPITLGGTGASTAAAALSNLGLTASSSELNTLDGLTATTAELNYIHGAKSSLQQQLDSKAAKNHGIHLPEINSASAKKFAASNGTACEWHSLSKDDITNALGYIPGTGSNVITAVKGNAETEYQTGNVNLTPAKLGLGNVDNTHDSEKSVLSAGKLTTARKIGNASFNGTANISLAQMGALGSSSADYIKALSISGQTITYTKGDGTTGALQTQNTWRGIQNNLTSTSTTDSLSAAQGAALNQKITALNILYIGTGTPAASSTYLIWIDTSDNTLKFRTSKSSATWIPLSSVWS